MPFQDGVDALGFGGSLDDGIMPPLASMEAVLFLNRGRTVPDRGLFLVKEGVDEFPGLEVALLLFVVFCLCELVPMGQLTSDELPRGEEA